MINRKFISLIFILFLFAGHSVFAADNTVDPRETAIDRAIGGMIEGSRPLSSQNYSGKNQIHKISGTHLNPRIDTKATASVNTPNSFNSTTIGNLAGGAAGNENANTTHGTGSTGANLEGTVSGGTSGGTGGVTESAVEPPTEPVTEPANNGSTPNSIVNVDANVDLTGGTPVVDANLEVDTNAGSLLDADVGVATDTASTDISATESGNIAGEDLNTTVNEAPVDAVLDAEVVATDIPSESEATAGLEADVDPVTADSDVALTDPADGLGL